MALSTLLPPSLPRRVSLARLTLAPYVQDIHFKLADGTPCNSDDNGAIKFDTGGYAAKGALPSVQAPLTCAH